MVSDPHAKELMAELEGLPLALATAGAYLNNMSTSLADYLRSYRESWLRIHKSTPDLPSYDQTLYTTWAISVSQIVKRNKSAYYLLELWAYFDNHDLWFGLLAAAREYNFPEQFLQLTKDESSFNEAIRPLCDFAFVQSLGIGRGYSMHSCVHAWNSWMNHDYILAQALQVGKAEIARIYTAWLGALFLQCCHKFCFRDPDHIERTIPHFLRILERIIDSSVDSCANNRQLLSEIVDIATYCITHAKRGRSGILAWRLTDAFERVLGPNDSLTLSTVQRLGEIYLKESVLDEAKAYFHKAMKGFEEVDGLDGIDTLTVMCRLADVYDKQREGEKLYVSFRKVGNVEAANMILQATEYNLEKRHVPDKEDALQDMLQITYLCYAGGNLNAFDNFAMRAIEWYQKQKGLKPEPAVLAAEFNT